MHIDNINPQQINFNQKRGTSLRGWQNMLLLKGFLIIRKCHIIWLCLGFPSGCDDSQRTHKGFMGLLRMEDM